MKIGFTTTIPVEIILAAGDIPVDMNNIFVNDKSPTDLIEFAHNDGLPRNMCAWIKGMYAVALIAKLDAIVAVTNGDCSNTHALSELLINKGVTVYHFSYPYGSLTPKEAITAEFNNLARQLNTPMSKVYEQFTRLETVREKLRKLDDLTVAGYINGEENHIWLVSSTDFNGDPDIFEKKLDTFLAEVTQRVPNKKAIPLGYIGVPPIISDIYKFISQRGGEIVFNEVQRQFSIPSQNPDFLDRYIDYTYPYDIFGRVKDIKFEIEKRKLKGVIHYVQTFCYRQIQDIIIKKELNVPVLTIEADSPQNLDERSKIRIESFIEMLMEKENA